MGDHPITERYQPRDKDLTWREIDDEIILLDLLSALYLRLNATGAVLWDRLVEGATLSDLAQRLQDVYGLDAQQAAADAEAFVKACEANNLLRLADD